MDEDSDWSSASGFYRSRFNPGQHNRSPDYAPPPGRPPHLPFFYHHPHPPPSPSSPAWNQDPWYPNNTTTTSNTHPRPLHPSTSSSRSTFEEVESLCLSRSSADSFGPVHNAQRTSSSGSFRSPYPHHPPPPPASHFHGRGQAARAGGTGGRFLSRQSSTTSTSTSSGNVAGEALERRSGSTSTSGSLPEEAMETLDPRQQFDLHEHGLLDGIFRRVLEWNNAHAALGSGRGGGGGGGGGVLPFPQVPPGNVYPSRFYPSGYGPPPHSPQSPHSAMQGGGVNPYTRPVPVVGQRVPDTSKDKTLSPSSDITHVKKRRDLILPDEEEDFSSFHRAQGSRHPDSSSSPRMPGKTQGSSSGGASSSFSSSKLTSTDSWLSSSSLSQSHQDLNWREHYGSGDVRPPPSWGEQVQSGWGGDPYARQWMGADPNPPSWREPSQAYSGPSPGMMLPPGFNMPQTGMSRGLSVESMNSYGIPSPPAAAAFPPSQYVPPPPRQNTAEMMLMNLGFGGSCEGFLPERFLKDWYNKVSRAQTQAAMTQAANAGSAGNSPHGSEVNLHLAQDPKAPLRSKPSYEDLRSASDLHRRITSHLSRAATISTSPSHESSEASLARLPPGLGSQSRTDRLKEYIEAHAHNVVNPPDAQSQRIRQFASSRQKSLPSYLETLTEEVETKGRRSAYRPQDGQSRLLTFLREDSFSGKSESQNTSSGCTSNSTSRLGSESESLSGSDHPELTQKKRQSMFTARGQLGHMSASQPAPVTHRLLTLRKQVSLDVEQEQFTGDLKTPDNLVTPSTPKRRHRSGHRSRHNSPKHQADSNQNSSAKLRDHLDTQQGGGVNSPVKCRSPKKERRSKSPDPRAKSPSHRPRSPRHQRGRSPCKEGKTRPVHDEVLRAKAPKSSCEDSSSSGSPHRRRASFSLGRKSPATDGKTASERKETSSPTDLATDKLGDKPVDEPGANQSLQTQCLLGSSQSQLLRSSNSEAEEQESTADLRPERSEPLVSTESLEVADIFQTHTNKVNQQHNNPSSETNSSTGRTKGELEPAMISIVLEDVDGNMTNSGTNLHAPEDHLDDLPVRQSEDPHPPEDLLPLPPCSSALSVSPIPMSPVTVIEVSLDNQQDSIDTEEGTSSSRDLAEELDLASVDSDALHALADILSEDTDPGGDFPGMVNFGPGCVSGSLPLLQCPPPALRGQVHRQVCDVGVEADDGSTSPLLLMLKEASPLMSSSSSSSSSPSVVGQSSNLSEIGIQSDDGRLTPLVLFRQDEVLSKLVPSSVGEELCVVSDQGVQCDGEVVSADARPREDWDTDYFDEAPLLEMAHKVTQTSRLVRYEMSSQTDNNANRQSSATPVQSINPPHWDSHFVSNSRTEFDTTYSQNFANRNCHVAPRELCFCMQPLPPTHHANNDVHKVSGSFSFESEFWDYLGMEIPWSLRTSETSLTMKQSRSCNIDIFSADRAMHDQHTAPFPNKAHSPNKASAYAVLPDMVNTFHSPSHHQKTMTSPGNPADHERHGTVDSRSPPVRPSNCEKMRHSWSERYSLSESLHQPTFPSEEKSQVSATLLPPVSMRHQSVNTCVTVPTDERDSNGDSLCPETSHCSFVKPFLFKPLTLQHNQLQEEEESSEQLHVSILSVNVNDYRNVNGRLPSTDSAWHGIPDSSKHSCAHSSVQEQPALKTDMLETCSISAAEPDKTSQQSCVCNSAGMELQSSEKPTKTRNGPRSYHDEFCSPDSSMLNRNLTSLQDSLLDDEVQQISTLGNVDMKDQTDTGDNRFFMREEAKQQEQKQFLLRSSPGSGHKVTDSLIDTVTDAEHDCVPSFEQKTDHSEKGQVVESGSDDAKAKALAMFMLRQSSVSPEMPSGPSQNFTDSPTESDRHQEQEVCKAEDKITARASAPATETAYNSSRNDFLPQELTSHIPDANLCRDETDSKEKVGNGFCIKDRRDKTLGNTADLSGKENTSAPVQNQNEALDDRQSWLLETFAHSVIESACHELQKNYLSNKQRLRERLHGKLKLSGVFATDTDNENLNTSDDAVAVKADTKAELTSDCDENHTERSGDVSSRSDAFTDSEDGIYLEGANRYTPLLDFELRSFQPSLNVDSDVSAEVPPFSDTSLCGIPDAECLQSGVQPCGSHGQTEDSHLPVQIRVEGEDDQVFDSAGLSSHPELHSDSGRLCVSRCLSSESFTSLYVNFSGSTDLIDDMEEEGGGEEEELTCQSKSGRSDSGDEILELSVIEPDTPATPPEEECQQSVTVIDTGQLLTCSCSGEEKVGDSHLPDLLMDKQNAQYCSPARNLRSLSQGNWFSNTIDMEGGEGLVHEPYMSELHQNQFEALLFDSHVSQDACNGYGLVGYLPRILEESENPDQVQEHPTGNETYVGGSSKTFNASQSNSSSETQSSEKSSSELSSEEKEFGIEVSLQPLPPKFKVDEVSVTSVDGTSVLTNSNKLTEQETETSNKSSTQNSTSLLSPSKQRCHSLDNASITSSWRVENREVKSPDLFTKSVVSSVKTGSTEENSAAMDVQNSYENVYTKHDSEITCTIQGDMTLDPTVKASDSHSTVSVTDCSLQDDSHTESTLHDYHLTNNTSIKPNMVPPSNNTESQSLYPEETKLATENKEPEIPDVQDLTDPYSSVFEETPSSPSPKPVRKFQRSISKESDTSNLSPTNTSGSVTAPSPGANPAECATGALHDSQREEGPHSENSLSNLGGFSSQSDQTLQPRLQSPVPEACLISGIQSPEKPCLQSPTRSLQSPEICILSPESCIQSPESCILSPESCILSPERGIQSPERCIQSPERSFQSPERYLQSMEKSLQSPERFSPPERSLQSPERSLQSPEIRFQSPERSLWSSEKSLLSQERSLQSPERSLRSLEKSLESPRRYLQSPQRSLQSPQNVLSSSERSLQSPEKSLWSSERYSLLSPEKSLESPKKYLQSPERSLPSPERSLWSPERSLLSPESRSPERYLQSPETSLQSPERSRRSPESRSPERSLQSPERSFQSLERSLLSPTRSLQSPTRSFHSPERSLHSPETSIHSPERSLHSPERSLQSPERSLQSPESQSPERSLQSTERSLQSPERSIQSPTRSLQSPEKSFQSPTRTLQSPTRSLQSPERYLHSPERSLQSPETSIQSPETSFQSLERSFQSPERSFQSPERSRQSPERSLRSPERSRQSPQRLSLQSSVSGRSSSPEKLSPPSSIPTSPKRLLLDPKVILCSTNKLVQPVSSSRETASDGSSSISGSVSSGICSPRAVTDQQISENCLTEESCVFAKEQSTIRASASFVNQLSSDDADVFSKNIPQTSETGNLANCFDPKNTEDSTENSSVHQQSIIPVFEKDENNSVPLAVNEASDSPQLQSEFTKFQSPSNSKQALVPKRPVKVFLPSRTLSSGDESPLHFTLSRTFYSSTNSIQQQPRSEGEKKSSSSESPIPSTPPLSRDPSSTSDSSSSVRDTQPASTHRLQPASVASARASFAQEGLGSRFIVTGFPSVGKSNTGNEINNSQFYDEADLLKRKELPETDQDIDKALSNAVSKSNLPQQPYSFTPTTKSAASPKSKTLVPLQVRRSRFQHMSNTMHVLEKSSSSDQSSAENGATPKRRFFWSTDQKTVVSPVHRRQADTKPHTRWLTAEKDQSYSSRNSDVSSFSDDSEKKDLDNSSKLSTKLPQSKQNSNKSEDSAGNIFKPSQFSGPSRAFGGSNSDLEGTSHSRQLRVSPEERESKSDSEIRLSPTSGHMSLNGIKKQSPRRSVRELAQQFESKGKE